MGCFSSDVFQLASCQITGKLRVAVYGKICSLTQKSEKEENRMILLAGITCSLVASVLVVSACMLSSSINHNKEDNFS